MTPLELWEKMLKDGSNVDKYLKNPEQLQKLMNAQFVTQFLDTRLNPEEPIDWDKMINVNSKDIQGVVKLKRADSDGNISTMTYVEPYIFDSYLEDYNSTGSEEARKKALSHFTIRENINTTIYGENVVTSGKVADVSQAIVNEITKMNKYGLTGSVCQAWVGRAYQAAGFGYTSSGCCAYLAGTKWGVSSDFSQIISGAAVWTGEGSYNGTQCSTHTNGGCGHAGIYYKDEAGNDWVIHFIGNQVKKDTLSHWLNAFGKGNRPVWGWQGGLKVEMQDEETSGNEDESNESESTEQTIQSLNNVLIIGDSIAGSLKKKLQNEGAIVKNQGGENAAFFLGEVGAGMDRAGVCAKGEKFNWDNHIASLSTPNGVCIILGQNLCGLGGNSREKGVEDIKRLVQKVQQQFPNVPVFINEVLPTTQNPTQYTKYMNGYSDVVEKLKQYCDTTEGVTFIKTLEGYITEAGYAKDNLTGDGLHPNNDGAEILVTNIKNKIVGSKTSGTTGGIVSNSAKYYAEVATWSSSEYRVESNDPSVSEVTEYRYNMTPTRINYIDMLKGFSMPFEYLWAFLVVFENQDFVLDLSDLVYNSKVELTVHDNLKETTSIRTSTYIKHEKVDTEAKAQVKYEKSDGTTASKSQQLSGTQTTSKEYTTIYTNIIKNNYVDVQVTLADIWMAKFTKEYTYQVPDNEETVQKTQIPDEDFASSPDEVTNSDTRGYSQAYLSNRLAYFKDLGLSNVHGSLISTQEEIYHKKTNNTEETHTTIRENKYISTPLKVEEKTDPNATEANFITIFKKEGYSKLRYDTLSVSSWLFEIIETNESTVDMLDLTKYLLYKANNINYGVTKYDFGAIWKKVYKGMASTAGAGDFVVHVDMSEPELVITDESVLENAIKSVYTGKAQTNLLGVLENGTFMKLQEEYKVNAVFAIAVAKVESGCGTGWAAISSSTYNWMSLTGSYKGKTYRNPASSNPRTWRVYPSFDEATLDFGDVIANGIYYFKNDKYSVKQIAPTYCNVGWGDAVISEMMKIYNAAGITINTTNNSTGSGNVVEEAVNVHSYLRQNGYYYEQNGITVPNYKTKTIDCSSYVTWVLINLGIDGFSSNMYQWSSQTFNNNPKNWQEVSVSEAQPGDIVVYYGGKLHHIEIIAENNSANKYFLVYNCGSNNAIRNSGTVSLPEAMKSNYLKSQATKILRVPINK